MNYKSAFTALLLAGLLCGCTQTPEVTPEFSSTTESIAEPETTLPETTEGETTEAAQANYEAQLDLIAENQSLWLGTEEDIWWSYAVTDLNGNGLLEIVATETHGTGNFTTTHVWEVSEDFQSLIPRTAQEADLTPILFSSTLPCYHNAEENRYVYVEIDTNKNGYAEYLESINAMELEGTLTRRVLARKHTVYSNDGSETVTCTDGEGNSITPEAYDSAADNAFSGFTKAAASLTWVTPESGAVTREMLETSWNGWNIA